MAYRVLRRGLYFASVAGCLTSQTGREGSAHTQNRGHDASAACEHGSNNVVKSRALFSCLVRRLAQHKGPSTAPPPQPSAVPSSDPVGRWHTVTGPENRDARRQTPSSGSANSLKAGLHDARNHPEPAGPLRLRLTFSTSVSGLLPRELCRSSVWSLAAYHRFRGHVTVSRFSGSVKVRCCEMLRKSAAAAS